MKKTSKIDLLISIYIFCIVVAELMGAKTFPLAVVFGYQLNASVAIFVFPLIFTINDIITEVYGRERTRSIIRASLVIIFLLIIVSLLFTILPPSARFAATEVAYDQIFSLSARISAASFTAFLIAEIVDVMVFNKIRQRLGEKALWLRTNASNFIAMFFDTTLFMSLAFYDFGLGFSENYSFLISLILPYWGLKMLASVIETPFAYWGVNWLKQDSETA